MNVINTTDPSMSLERSQTADHPNGSPYEDAGATCSDNYALTGASNQMMR